MQGWPHMMNETVSNLGDSALQGPTVLLTSSNRWPVVPRMAIALREMGCRVAVLCAEPGSSVQKTSSVERIFSYSGFHPLRSLRTAIEAFDPDIIVPCCDRSVQQLHELHEILQSQRGPGSSIAALIERSLGPPESFPIVSSRSAIIDAARAEGILVPETTTIGDIGDLKPGQGRPVPPWVIKADGTSGGIGVRIAHTQVEGERYFLELTAQANEIELVKKMLLNRDRGWVFFEWKRPRLAVIAQSLIGGRPANCAVACWKGQLLAGISVEVLRADGATGPASIVEVVENAEMMEAAKRIAHRLGLSGFFGLDFMIDNHTGALYLIEMNPRCTPPCPLPLGKGRDLIAAFCAQVVAKPLPARKSVISQSRIAYFPQAWANASELGDPLPSSCYKDVPTGEPELVSELLYPWSERSLFGRLADRIKRTRRQTEPVAYVTDQA